MIEITYILLAVIVAVVLIDLYLKRKNKLATTKEIEKVIDKENPEKPWWKRIWVRFKWNKKILIVISSIILIIAFLFTPEYFVEKSFKNGSYEEVISIAKNYRKVIKFNKKINKIYLAAKIQNQDLNNLFNEFNFSFEESEELLKYLLFKHNPSYKAESFSNLENWELILSLSHQIKKKYPTLSKDNVFVYIGTNIYYFNPQPWWIQSERLEEIMKYIPADISTAFRNVIQRVEKAESFLYSKHLKFYDEFYDEFKWTEENELIAFGVWDLVVESSVICASPKANYYWDFVLEDASTKYLERLIRYRNDFNKQTSFFIESKIFEKNTAYFDDIDLESNQTPEKLFEEKHMHDQYAFLALMYNDKGDTRMANRYIEKAINSTSEKWWPRKAEYYYSKFMINWNIRPYGDKNGACNALNQAFELWLENEDPDVAYAAKINKKGITEALNNTCNKKW